MESDNIRGRAGARWSQCGWIMIETWANLALGTVGGQESRKPAGECRSHSSQTQVLRLQILKQNHHSRLRYLLKAYVLLML